MAALASVPAPVVALRSAQEIGYTLPLTGPPVVVTAVTDLQPGVRCTQPGRSHFDLDTTTGFAHLALVAEALTRTTTGAAQHTAQAVLDLLAAADTEEVTPLPPAS